MHQTSDSPAAVTAVLGASVSSSNLSSGLRKVRLNDQELLQRVQRIVVPNEAVDFHALSARRGWKHVRSGVPGGMNMYFRSLPGVTSQQCQVVLGGEIRAQASGLLSLLRTPTESESNALLRALYGSRFIYTSLVHAIPSPERGSLSPLRSSRNAASGQQLMVRTVSFAHTRLSNPFKQRSSTPAPRSGSRTTSDSHNSIQHRNSVPKNEQCCYIELLTPTPDGFKIAMCSLDSADVMAGKAPPERVVELHPISGWFTAQSTRDDPDSLRITFQASFPGEFPGGCDSRVAQDRLLFIAKGLCRLEKVLQRRGSQAQPQSAPGRVWQALTKPFKALGASEDGSSEGAHHNWHCIACTRSFLLPTLRKKWRRCDLCAYRVCADPPCCSQERVAIYSRYVAPLLVCARCRECIDDQEGHPGSTHRVGSATGDTRYAGLSLRFTDHGNELEPELELESNLDPTNGRHDQWGVISTTNSARRSSTGSYMKRRTQSDPPPVLGLEFSSSGESNSSQVIKD